MLGGFRRYERKKMSGQRKGRFKGCLALGSGEGDRWDWEEKRHQQGCLDGSWRDEQGGRRDPYEGDRSEWKEKVSARDVKMMVGEMSEVGDGVPMEVFCTEVIKEKEINGQRCIYGN